MSAQKDRTIVITGGTGGIGLQSALGLTKTGNRILITGRNQERGEAAVQRIRNETDGPAAVFIQGDLSSMAGIDRLASDIRASTEKINVLINNAGYLGSQLCQSDDGLEMHFAVNVLAPWRLTRALRSMLRVPGQARVLNITGGDKPARIDPQNLQAEKGFKGLMTYTHSKSVLESMSMCLARELEPEGIAVNVIFPGRASTAMTRSLSSKSLPGPMKLMYPLFRLIFREDGGKSAARAARSTIWGANSPEIQGITGAYFDTHSAERKLHPTAYDPTIQARIRAVLDAAEGVSGGTPS